MSTDQKWMELSISVEPERVQEIASFLGHFGQGGAIIEDLRTGDKPENNSVVKIYLPRGRTSETRKIQIKNILSERYALKFEERILKPEDWLEPVKRLFDNLPIGDKLLIKASWAELPPGSSSRVVVEIDPGMAFGTGLHATTRLSLNNLEKEVKPGSSILDMGTGSGILAIAGVKLGAAMAVAIDNDPLAVKVAKDNTVANNVAQQIRVNRGSLGLKTQREFKDRFDLCVANITPDIIISLAGALHKVLKPGGTLITSGINEERLDEVLIILSMMGQTIKTIDHIGEWWAVVSIKE